MLNERKLTDKELDQRAETIQGLLSNKRTLVKKYGRDAEKVMYGIATKQAKSKVENMNKEKIKELIQLALQKEAETVPTVPHSTTDLTKTVDTGFSGRADYGEEDKALGQEDELEMKGLEEQVDKFNLDVFGYETKYFKVCPGAKTFMDKVMAKGYGDKSDDKEKVIRLAKLHDLLFVRELKALKDPEYAADILGTAKFIAAEIKKEVNGLNIPVEDVSYIDNHIEIIKDQAKKADSRITEGHGLGQKDLDTLESLRNQIEQGTLDSKKQDEFVKVLNFLIKSNILQDKTKDLSKGKVTEGHGLDQGDLNYLKDIVQPGGPVRGRLKKILNFIIKSNILQDKTKDLSKDKVDENLIKEFVGGETEKRISVLFDKLVPSSGNADTVEGEIIRAINRIIYRWGNDGDHFARGYGAETVGPAMEYLTDAFDIPLEIRAKFEAWENDNFSNDYDKGELIDLAQIALQYVEKKVREDDLTPTQDDLLNYGGKYRRYVRDMEFMNEGHMMKGDDLDVDHVDNEPRMLKKELARAGKMIQMLYRAIDKYDGKGEVDFPQWWQSKIIKANDYLDSAFDYLDGEESVAKIDAMIDVVGEEISSKNYAKGIEVVKDTLSKEGGAAGLEPLVKELVKLGFKKSDVIELLKNMTSVKKHRDGDYILLPLEEKIEGSEAKKLKKIEKELNKASKMHKSQADRIGKLVKEILTEMDGGQLFDYFANKGYKVTERRPDGREAGFEGYMVSRGDGPYPQSVIIQYNKDNDRFMISRMGGYRIDQKEAIKAGMREQGYSGIAGRDAYITDGNYKPVDISVEGLKDIVDHVMTGLDREAKAQGDFYRARGRTSGTIDEKIRLAVEKKLTAAEKDKKEDIIKSIAKQKGGKKKLEPVDYAVATDRAKKLAEEFKVGQKVTYLGNPGEITLVDKDVMDRVYYNVLYDKGTGKTKATNIYNKDGEIKTISLSEVEEKLQMTYKGDPVNLQISKFGGTSEKPNETVLFINVGGIGKRRSKGSKNALEKRLKLLDQKVDKILFTDKDNTTKEIKSFSKNDFEIKAV